jgi:hypothetical protein
MLYGSWGNDFVDWQSPEQSGETRKEIMKKAEKPEKEKKKKKKRKVIKGEDYAKTAESKAGVKKYQRRDRPYKGWKSDVAWLKKHGKARVSGGND